MRWAECRLPRMRAALCNTPHTDEGGDTREGGDTHELALGGCTCGSSSASLQAANPAVVSGMLLLRYRIPELLGHRLRW